MRVRFSIFGLVALALGGIAPALATVPGNLELPLPPNAKISIPVLKPVEFLSAEAVPIARNLHIEIASQLVSGPLRIREDGLAPARADGLQLGTPAKQATAAAVEWDFSKWGSLGLATQNGAGTWTLLGDFTPRPLSSAEPAETSAAALSAHVKLGDGWVTSFSYSADVRQLDLRAGPVPALAEHSSHGQSYGLSIAKHGVFDDADALGLSVSRPSDEYFGSISLADAGLENSVSLVNNYKGLGLNSGRETDIALGYVTSFFHGALSLQANAGYQMNANGQNGANGITVLSRAKINF